MTEDRKPPAEQIADRDDEPMTVINTATEVDGNVVQAGVIHGGVTIRGW